MNKVTEWNLTKSPQSPELRKYRVEGDRIVWKAVVGSGSMTPLYGKPWVIAIRNIRV
jgi:hypothetical protein